MTLGGLGKDDDLEEQLDPLNFHNSDNCLSNLIVYLYAMDAFLFDELNRASIEQDSKKVKNFGPLAISLRSILFGASGERTDIDKHQYKAYRGLIL